MKITVHNHVYVQDADPYTAQMAVNKAKQKYERFIASITNRKLAERIDDSAQQNAHDTHGKPSVAFWGTALITARMLLDDRSSDVHQYDAAVNLKVCANCGTGYALGTHRCSSCFPTTTNPLSHGTRWRKPTQEEIEKRFGKPKTPEEQARINALIDKLLAKDAAPRVIQTSPGNLSLGEKITASLFTRKEGATFSGWVVRGYGNMSDPLPNRAAAVKEMLSIWQEHNPTTDLPFVNITGRGHFYYNETKIKNHGNGKYEVTVPRGTYKVFGGIKAGGSRTEWYVEGPEINGALWVKSLTDAVHQIHNI